MSNNLKAKIVGQALEFAKTQTIKAMTVEEFDKLLNILKQFYGELH